MIVVLKLAGDPVAVARSLAPDHKISEDQRLAIVGELRRQQDGLEGSIEAMGGKVLNKFQHALNGIKVSARPEQIPSLALLPGVVGVQEVLLHQRDNAVSVPFIGAPAVWQGPPGLHGEHIKVAILDTGIDYTHANFGGPGTAQAYLDAFAHGTESANSALFGPGAPKVKGGTDLVGDLYDAGNANPARRVPHPDANPLDCAFFPPGVPAANVGHGSHVAGTAAGFGVKADGTTFTGPYNAGTPATAFRIGPGVAPLADLYAVRVFGCEGSTNVVVDALDWAVKNDMDVVNMSLGSVFGNPDSADAEASNNAVNAGVLVVASAGNSGPALYIHGSPASGDKVVAVAAVDSTAAFAAASLTLAPNGSIVTINANSAVFSNGTKLNVFVLPDTSRTGRNGVSLGCDENEFRTNQTNIQGKLVVTLRGVRSGFACARVDRAVFGQRWGAAAVALINNAAGFPPREGDIFDGDRLVTIPFLGIRAASSTSSPDGNALAASTSATFTNSTIANPSFRQFASFSSGGPRLLDSVLKPDVSAPGVSTVSTGAGSGNRNETLSGTSMAAPHVAGSAALALQSHPGWPVEAVRAALLNTADASQVAGFNARLGGSGLVQPFAATRTSVVATSGGRGAANFGVAEFERDFRDSREILVSNLGSSTASFNVSTVPGLGSPHTATVRPSSISVRPGRQERVTLTLSVPAATAGDATAFRQVSGFVALTPTTASGNGGVNLSVPYFLLPRARAQVRAELEGDLDPGRASTAAAELRNNSGVLPATADFYTWGLSGTNKRIGAFNLRAVGVQAFDHPTLGRMLVFAVNTFSPWTTAAVLQFQISIDSTGDGIPDFMVLGGDAGFIQTNSSNGTVASFVLNLKTGKLVRGFLATAPTGGTTILLPAVAADIGVTSGNPRFSYSIQSFDRRPRAGATVTSDSIAAIARFNAFASALSNGQFLSLAPGERAVVPVALNPVEFAATPALGVMVVTLDNANKGEHRQAMLLRLDDEEDED